MNDSPEVLPTDNTNEAKPKPRWWRLRWSMRGFFAAITLLCVIFGLVGQRLYVGLIHADVGKQLTLPPVDTSIPLGLPSEEHVHIGWTIPQDPVGRIDFARDNKLPTWMKWTNSDVLFRRLDQVLISNSISDQELTFTFEQIHRLGELRELLIRRKLTHEELDRLLSPLQIQKLAIYPLEDQNEPYAFLHNIGVEDLEMHAAPVAVTENLPVSLKRLDISGSNIDDDSLDQFAQMKNLEELDLSRTITTKGGVQRLREKMPWCEVIWEKRIWWRGRRMEQSPSP